MNKSKLVFVRRIQQFQEFEWNNWNKSNLVFI